MEDLDQYFAQAGQPTTLGNVYSFQINKSYGQLHQVNTVRLKSESLKQWHRKVLFYCLKLGGNMSETTAAVAETSAAALGSKATVTGGAASFAGFFMGIDWMGWVGIGVAVLGLLINVYFSWQRNQREKEIHELTKRKLNGACNVKQD